MPLASEYLWNLASEYQRSAEAGNAIGRFLFRAVTPYVREFDRRAAQTVTAFIANSRLVQDRVKSCYRRNSVVIHPPINVDDFAGEVNDDQLAAELRTNGNRYVHTLIRDQLRDDQIEVVRFS